MKKPNKEDNITRNKTQITTLCFALEINVNSKKDINTSKNSIPLIEKMPKKSIDLCPKKINIEKIDDSLDVYRKYTMENQLIIKDFVPQLRPIKIHIIPSKLCLNKKGFKDLKFNKENKKLLNSSCPNLEDENEYDNDKDKNTFESSNDIISLNIISDKNQNISHIIEDRKNFDIKGIRKNMQKIKRQNIHKINSKNTIIKSKIDNCFNFCNSSESDLYDIDEIDNYSLLEYEKNEENKNESISKEEDNKRARTRSFSILEMLQKKFNMEEE